MAGTNSNNQVGVNTHIDNVYNTTTVSNFISLTNSKFDLNTDLYQTSNETDKNLVGDILYVPNWSIKDFIEKRSLFLLFSKYILAVFISLGPFVT